MFAGSRNFYDIDMVMSGSPTLQNLLEKLDVLKARLESSRTTEEKLVVLMEFRFLLDAADELIRKSA
jgi:hypothetical protein